MNKTAQHMGCIPAVQTSTADYEIPVALHSERLGIKIGMVVGTIACTHGLVGENYLIRVILHDFFHSR